MDLDSADTWRWIWLVAAAVFALGELAVPGSFFMISFAAGAVIAAIASFLGADVALGWILFVAGTGLSLLLLVPLGRRWNRDDDVGPTTRVGADRWAGQRAVVTGGIPAGVHATGLVRVEREEWRAESIDSRAVAVGTEVRVVRVDGTRLVVAPVEDSP